jgi:phosphate ABC transporter phosphate-binding protein
MKILAAIVFAILVSSFTGLMMADAKNQYTITGAGATFPFPLIDLWRVKYAEERPDISLNYQSIGSGGGIKQHTEKTVNFAATDAPLTASEAELTPGTLHIPEAIGGVTISYNIPEVPQKGLKLTGEQVANIFSGKITKWNDPSIQEINPDLSLPDKNVLVAHRSDGSGTTFVFTEYLSKVSQNWHDEIGTGKSVPWPVGVGAAGNEGVATTVRTTPYAIGYVELAYAIQNEMTFAYVQNGDRTDFIEPTLETMSSAAAGAAPTLPAADASWQGVSINNAPGSNSYPITSFTYLLVYQNLEKATPSKEHAQETVNLIKWMISDGQQYADDLLYVPIPAEVTEIGMRGLDMITYDGGPVFGETMTEETQSQGGGCLIATAAFGTEMAPSIQILREVRDNTVFSTGSGTAFMSAFNNAYYSFSPTVADWERQSPAFKELVRIAITPMLSTLSILNYAEIDSEQEMLGYGIGIILLNTGMYLVAPALIVLQLRKRIFKA